MSQLDRLKEQIGWLKVVFGLLFATDISLIAYLFNSIDVLSLIQLVFVVGALLLTTASLVFINKKAMEKIDSLEDL
jgi:hypothetical protein